MQISYAISVCDEYLEIQQLLYFLIGHKREQDEIVVLVDMNKNEPTSELLGYLHKQSSKDKIRLIEAKFTHDFSEWKNILTKACKGDFIFNIDADENPHDLLLDMVPDIIEANPEMDVYLVPRINIVSGITPEHIAKWGWNITKLESVIGEKEFDLNNPTDLAEYEFLKDGGFIIE
jgi:hypothetical protein